MFCLHGLNRLALKAQNLDLFFASRGAGYRTIRISTVHGANFRTNLGAICRPLLARPLVAPRQPSTYVQLRANYATAGTTKLEKFLLPDIGEGIKEVVIKSWQVKVGDIVKEFDPICEVESDKATATITSRYDGKITSVHYEEGDMAQVGQPLVVIEMSGDSVASQVKPKEERPTSESVASDCKITKNQNQLNEHDEKSKGIIQALPSVRRFAQEMKVDLALIKATGSRGQVLKDDILAYLAKQSETSNKVDERQSVSSSSVPSSVSTTKSSGPDQAQSVVVPLRGIQKAMFKTMTESLKIPHFNYADEIDLTQLVEAKSSLQQRTGDSTKKIANFAIIIKMVSLALLDYPQLNASIDNSGESLIYKNYHNIGVAVDTQAGLIVPNIKNVQNLSVEQVNSELLRLRELGYASKLGPGDLSGATITLSNIGAVGGIFGVPVIVAPEIVIGALGRTQKLPRFNSHGQVEARHILQLVWSADHRVVDGATLSRFSNLLKRYLENPHSALVKLT